MREQKILQLNDILYQNLTDFCCVLETKSVQKRKYLCREKRHVKKTRFESTL